MICSVYCAQCNLACVGDSGGKKTPLISGNHVWSTLYNTAQLLFLSPLRG